MLVKNPPLYCAASILEQFDGCQNVWVDWVVPFRRHPRVDYHQILGENRVDQPDARQWADELFLPDEIRLLRNYLKRRRIDLSIQERTFPTWPGSLVLWHAKCPEGEINLNQQLGYKLPFPVRGFFSKDLPQPEIPPVIRKKARRRFRAVCRITGRAFRVKPPYAYFLESDHNSLIDPSCLGNLKESCPEIDGDAVIATIETTPRVIGAGPVEIECPFPDLSLRKAFTPFEESPAPVRE